MPQYCTSTRSWFWTSLHANVLSENDEPVQLTKTIQTFHRPRRWAPRDGFRMCTPAGPQNCRACGQRNVVCKIKFRCAFDRSRRWVGHSTTFARRRCVHIPRGRRVFFNDGRALTLRTRILKFAIYVARARLRTLHVVLVEALVASHSRIENGLTLRVLANIVFITYNTSTIAGWIRLMNRSGMV